MQRESARSEPLPQRKREAQGREGGEDGVETIHRWKGNEKSVGDASDINNARGGFAPNRGKAVYGAMTYSNGCKFLNRFFRGSNSMFREFGSGLRHPTEK